MNHLESSNHKFHSPVVDNSSVSCDVRGTGMAGEGRVVESSKSSLVVSSGTKKVGVVGSAFSTYEVKGEGGGGGKRGGERERRERG